MGTRKYNFKDDDCDQDVFYTVFLEACLNSNIHEMNEILDSGIDFNELCREHNVLPRPILFYLMDNMEVLRELAKREEIDFTIKDSAGRTLLFDAKNKEAVDIILKKGVDINAKDKFFEKTALHEADTRKSPEASLAIIDAGANVNAEDKEGKTPLFFAFNVHTIRKLREKGADINVTTYELNLTPLHTARSPEAAQEFIDQGIDPSAYSGIMDVASTIFTPLSYHMCSMEVCRVILKNGGRY